MSNEQHQIQTLKKIKSSDVKGKLFTTIGLIVDAANPFRKDVKKDFCMKVKIIDPSYYNSQCVVFLFNKNLEVFPRNVKVGDILLVRSYAFEVEGEKLAAKKPFNNVHSEFRFFSGLEESGYNPIDNNVGIDDKDGAILNSINALRKFSRNHFKSENVPLYTNSSKQASDFDLILKVSESVESENGTWRITLNDAKNNIYQMNHSRNVVPGVYKIRSIAHYATVNGRTNLVGNDYTNFIELSEWMKSYQSKEWEKLSIGKSEIEHENATLATKALHDKRGDKRKFLTLKDLIVRENHSEDVKVKVEIMEVFTKFEDALKKFDEQNMVEKDYQYEGGKYIYNVHLAINDPSLEGDIFNVYIYTYDGQGLEFLPGMDPDKIYGRNTTDYRVKYDHIVNRLLEETSLDEPLELTLSPMFNGKETVYRIVDTQLIL